MGWFTAPEPACHMSGQGWGNVGLFGELAGLGALGSHALACIASLS